MQNSNHYDVIILGGGIAGAATADVLARRGQKTLLLDQFEPGHEYGSSHGDGRVIRFEYPEDFYLQMARLSLPLWESLSERAGERLISITGMWSCGEIGGQSLQDLRDNWAATNTSYQAFTAAESNREFPYFHLAEGSEALFQPNGGAVLATPSVKALWRLAQANGATTETNERIEEIEVQSDSVRVRSWSGQRWSAARLVVTAGSWAQAVCQMLGVDLKLEVTQEQLTYFPVTNGLDHSINAMPVFSDFHTPSPFYGIPQIEVPGVKVGWHHSGTALTDPESRLPVNDTITANVQKFAAERFPHLDSTKPFAITTCLYTNTLDYHFILDRHPSHSHIVIGAGFSGHGFKFGPLLGEILAALATDETPPVSLDPFTISRLSEPEKLQRRKGA